MRVDAWWSGTYEEGVDVDVGVGLGGTRNDCRIGDDRGESGDTNDLFMLGRSCVDNA